MAVNVGVLTANRTASGDEMFTPRYAVYPLLEFLPASKTIWCPFDTQESNFYKVLKMGGYKVICSHISEDKDFFKYEPPAWDILISNPPYSIKDDVLERAFALGKPFALLLPISSLQGQKRFRIFKNRIEVLAFDRRIHYVGNDKKCKKNVPFGSAYFCRDFLPSKLELREIKKEDTI